ncbi:MAG: MBL fold metallo-hydrolase [Gammaproteobacteria bacterium]|nr:MBL fold metallo-hydrolase [Gammaproteobacteria bacterium]
MREAVSAVLVHGDQLFAVRRQPHLLAFPGYIAFPGGKVDKGDSEHAFDHPKLNAFPAYQIRALCRELQEEIGFDLESALMRGEVRSIALLGTAVTPSFAAVRFSVPHYKIELNRKPAFTPDSEEIAWAGWVQGGELWRQFMSGETLMVAPTRNIVQTLAADMAAQRVDPINIVYDEESELPYLELITGVGLIPVPSLTLPPARFTNALRLGDPDCPVCLVDPSPKDGDSYDKLLRTLQRYPVDRILITHHHRDHHQQAPDLARRLGLPILCSARTEQRLRASYGAGYLDGVSVATLQEGDVVTRWQGREVRAHYLPGHDDGMLGLAPEDYAWFMVSDLVQTQGSVVIPEPEGEMRAYLNSLQRVISLKPGVIIPAHGLPAGETWLLEQVFAHRMARERQIESLHQSGSSIDEMVASIYVGLDRKLLPLAQQNVRQHLRKLGLSTE